MSVLRALRLPHLLGLGLVVAVLGGGLPTKWFGLVGDKVSEAERLATCMKHHEATLAGIVTNLGSPSSLLQESPAERRHDVRLAERRRQIDKREGQAIVACARTVAASPGSG